MNTKLQARRYFFLILVLILPLALSACGDGDKKKSSQSSVTQSLDPSAKQSTPGNQDQPAPSDKSTIEQPSSSDQPAPGDVGAAQPPSTQMSASLDELPSYRMSITMRSPDVGGTGWGADEKTEMEWNRSTQAERLVMYDAAGSVMTEIITIGADNWINMGDAWMHSIEQNATGASSSVDLDAMLQDLQAGMTLLGQETVNDVYCKHYSIDSDFSIDMPDFAGEGMRTVTGHIQGEMWLADQAGLPPVVIRSKSESTMNLFEGAALTMYEERDVYDIGAPITIEPPANAVEAPVAPPVSSADVPALPAADAGTSLQVASLGDLNSYHLEMTSRTTTAEGEGIVVVMTEEWVREPLARRLAMSLGEGMPGMEYVVVGNSAWLNLGGTWTAIPESEVEDLDDNLSPMITPDPSMMLVGQEVVNGIPCKHYVADVEMPSQSLHQEMWVADQEGLPAVAIRSIYRMEIRMEQMNMVTEGEVNVTNINAPITIEPPQ